MASNTCHLKNKLQERNMKMIIDLVVLAVIAICILVGAKRGLILSMISILSLVIALVVGYLLMPVVGGAINMTPIPEKAENSVYVYIHDALSAEDQEADYKAALDESSLPAFIKNKVEKVIDQSGAEQTADQISRTAAKAVASAAVKIVAVLLVTVVTFILLNSMKFIWKGLRNISVIRKIDTIGGLAFGLGQSILIICAVMLIISLLSSIGLASGAAMKIQDSFLGGFFYEYNFLGMLIALFI